MKLHVLGVFVQKGKSDKGPYEFAQLIYRKPIEEVDRPNVRIHGYGFREGAVDLDQGSLEKFASLQGQFPLDLELITQQEVGPRGIRAVVCGFKVATPASVSPGVPSSTVKAA